MTPTDMAATTSNNSYDKATKLAIFRRCFASGLQNVYGTYDPATSVVRQIKAPVTDAVLLAHLTGRQPYGVYLLVGDRTRAIAADFDHDDLAVPIAFVRAAANYGITAYIERSKRKGYHGWIFLEDAGVLAWKARTVVKHVLAEIGQPGTEVFPKQDRLIGLTNYGNFINAPLFYPLRCQDRTVFLDQADPTKPAADQWQLLDSVARVNENMLDELIEINGWARQKALNSLAKQGQELRVLRSFMLPPCSQHMLQEGVSANQRVACFRLAVQLKRVGMPFDIALASLQAWAAKNTPSAGKGIITSEEIESQTRSAYEGEYRSFGCEDPAISPFCDATCPVNPRKQST